MKKKRIIWWKKIELDPCQKDLNCLIKQIRFWIRSYVRSVKWNDGRAGVVLWWEITWEHPVSYSFFFFSVFQIWFFLIATCTINWFGKCSFKKKKEMKLFFWVFEFFFYPFIFFFSLFNSNFEKKYKNKQNKIH